MRAQKCKFYCEIPWPPMLVMIGIILRWSNAAFGGRKGKVSGIMFSEFPLRRKIGHEDYAFSANITF
jgi:hypothetical protein